MKKVFQIFIAVLFSSIQSSCLRYKASRMSEGEVTLLSTTQIQNYRLELIKKHGWVGPPNFFYDLKTKNIFGHYKTEYSLEVTMPDTLKCVFELKNKKGQTLQVDKCKRTVLSRQ